MNDRPTMPTESPSSVVRKRRPLFGRMAALSTIIGWLGARKADERRYNWIFVATAGPPVLIMLILALMQEPLRGDLTRLGGYTENRYGWTEPQKRFVPPLVSLGYDRPHDIVVVGDSFSSNPDLYGQTDNGAYWVNYVAQRTGLSVAVLRLPHATLRDVVDSPVFKAAPPRLVILENVERYLVRNNVLEPERWLGPGIRGCPDATAPPRRAGIRELRPMSIAPVTWHRDRTFQPDFGQAADLFGKHALRVLGFDITPVLNLPLVTDRLFSSRASDRLLVYDEEFDPEGWSRRRIGRAICNLLAAQELVQRNGQTAFAFLIAPDKLTAYAELIADEQRKGVNRLPEFYRENRLNQIRVLEALRAAIHRHVQDVYLPNDTHWGSAAHEIVADQVVAHLAATARASSERP